MEEIYKYCEIATTKVHFNKVLHAVTKLRNSNYEVALTVIVFKGKQ